jgi:hypothetical protein
MLHSTVSSQSSMELLMDSSKKAVYAADNPAVMKS